MVEKYGIWKIHQHFDLKNDEVFHETSDEEKKLSTLSIIKKASLPKNAYPTSWKLTNAGAEVVTWCGCVEKPPNNFPSSRWEL